MYWRSILTGCLLIILAAACVPVVPPGANENTQTPPTETRLAQTETIQATGTSITATPGPLQTAAYDPALEAYVQLAKEDLAAYLGVSIDVIQVIEAKSVTWPDASLGCPQPGMNYIQVPQDGALIRLSASGSTYDYHSGGSEPPFLCEQPLKIKETPILLDTYVPTPAGQDE